MSRGFRVKANARKEEGGPSLRPAWLQRGLVAYKVYMVIVANRYSGMTVVVFCSGRPRLSFSTVVIISLLELHISHSIRR